MGQSASDMTGGPASRATVRLNTEKQPQVLIPRVTLCGMWRREVALSVVLSDTGEGAFD